MIDKKNSCTLFLITLFAASISAETLVMSKEDSGDVHGFYTATDWARKDGSVINAVPESGNDYIVANGCLMNVNGTHDFSGDSLQLGDNVLGDADFLHSGGGSILTIPLLKLVSGRYRVWQNKASVKTSYLEGNVEVLSSAETPFLISPTHIGSPTSYEVIWNANLTGVAGTGIQIASLSNVIGDGRPRIVFNGDNSAYKGKISVKDTNLTFCVTRASALGGALDVFKDDALFLNEQCIFECTAESEVFSASANRGIKVGRGGARILLSEGRTLVNEWPVTLEGQLEKIGGGTLVLGSDLSSIENGRFVVSEGGVVVPVGQTNVVDYMDFSGGILMVSYDAETGACGVLELTKMTDGKITVKPPAVRGVKFPFLRVPISGGNMSPDDFMAISNLASLGLPSFAVTVEVEDNYQVAYIETAKIIDVAAEASSTYALEDPSGWSDGEKMHACGDYVLDAKKAARKLSFSVGTMASLDENVLNYTIPSGSSLTFTGADKNADKVENNLISQWLIRQKTFSGDVRAVGRRIEFIACGNTKEASLYPYEDSMGDEHVLKGRLYISNNATSDDGTKIMMGCSRTLKIESEISGDGILCVRTIGNSVSTRNGTYIFSGTNSFSGKLFLYNPYETVSTNIFRFYDERNLGPGTAGKETTLHIQADSKQMVSDMILYPIGSVTVNLPNRPLYFYSGKLSVKVDEEHELKWDSSVWFRSGTTKNLTCVTKLGEGIWAIGGNVKLKTEKDVEDIWIFNVDEGFIRADNARAFSGMTVMFADGAGIAAKYNPGSDLESAQYGMIVTNAAMFTVSGAKLPVKIDTNGDAFFNKSLPVLTVPADAADGVGAKLKGITDIPMGSVSFVRECVALDGKECVRFSAEVHRGTVITVR